MKFLFSIDNPYNLGSEKFIRGFLDYCIGHPDINPNHNKFEIDVWGKVNIISKNYTKNSSCHSLENFIDTYMSWFDLANLLNESKWVDLKFKGDSGQINAYKVIETYMKKYIYNNFDEKIIGVTLEKAYKPVDYMKKGRFDGFLLNKYLYNE